MEFAGQSVAEVLVFGDSLVLVILDYAFEEINIVERSEKRLLPLVGRTSRALKNPLRVARCGIFLRECVC